jgi:SAC3 domain-containing protein 1
MEASLNDDVLGSCLEMCSPAERNARQRQKRLHVFEMSSNTHPNHPVKEFSRSAAGKQVCSSELRPAGVLLTTMEYLLNEIVDRKDQPWIVVYHFVFDRIRAIRQDMVIQRIGDGSAVQILEKAARFHIFAGFNLCDTSMESFDARINDNHIQECLKRLLVLYVNYPCSQNRAEFECYYLLHNLGSHEAMEHALTLPEYIKCRQIFKTTWNMSLMNLLCNFVGLFRLAEKLPFLASCLVQKHCAAIRHSAVAVLNTAYSNPKCQYPLTELSSILMFDHEQESQYFLAYFGIEVINGFIKFSKKSYIVPDKLPTSRKCCCITNKYAGPIKKILQDSLQEIHHKTERESERIEDQYYKEKSGKTLDESSIEKTNVTSSFPSGVSKPFSGRGRGRGRGFGGSHLLSQNSRPTRRGRGRCRGKSYEFDGF